MLFLLLQHFFAWKENIVTPCHIHFISIRGKKAKSSHGPPPTVAPAGLNLAGSQMQDLCGSGSVTELTAAEEGQRLGGAWKGVPKQLKAVPCGTEAVRPADHGGGVYRMGVNPGESAVRGCRHARDGGR